VIERSCRCSLVVAAPDVQDETPVVTQDPEDLLCKREKPLHVVVLVIGTKPAPSLFLLQSDGRWLTGSYNLIAVIT
jgi:hypothetical protein